MNSRINKVENTDGWLAEEALSSVIHESVNNWYEMLSLLWSKRGWPGSVALLPTVNTGRSQALRKTAAGSSLLWVHPPSHSYVCLVLAEFCSFEHYGCKYTEALFLTMSWFQAALIASIDRKCLLSLQGRELPRVSDLLLHCSQVISTRASTLPGFWENLLHCCLSLSCCAGSVLISLVPAYQVDRFSLLGRYTFHSSRKY